MELSKVFCEFIKRQLQGLNLSQFAKKAHVARPFLTGIAKGEQKRITLDFGAKVCVALGYTFSDVIRHLEKQESKKPETDRDELVEITLPHETWEQLQRIPEANSLLDAALVRHKH